ncbi:hypothetical protein H0H93_016940, partial [Arthromyces matolae]
IRVAEVDYQDARRQTRTGEKRKKETKEEIEDLEEAKRDHLINSYKLWWMCIHIIYEIKHSRSEAERFQAANQTLGYMRQLLMEQLDRRFVMGFTLLCDQLSVMLCDRSGVVMTSGVIDIHKASCNPQKLIQLIAGFSIMTPEQLGWDTSMKIYRFHSNEDPAHPDVKPSYEVATQFQDQLQVNQSRYTIHWVIDVEEAGNTEQYVTVSTISAIRFAEICSRASIVFEVIKFKERRDPKA